MFTTMFTTIVLRCSIWLLLVGTSLSAAALPDSLTLLAVPPVNAPEIANKRIKTTINLIFDRTPPEYWIYYKKESGRLVCEFFGVHLRDTSFTLRGTDILRDPQITNGTTDMALNKKHSTISFEMEQGWHYESWVMPGNVLKLQVWMPLDPEKRLNSKKKKGTVRSTATDRAKFRRHQHGSSVTP